MSPPALESALPARAHHLPPAAVAVVAVGLLVGLPELLGDLGRLAAVLVLQLGFVLAWVLVTGIQGFAGSLAVGAAAAVAADLVLVLPARGTVGGLLVVFGVGFLAVVLQQMFRRPRPELVASLAGQRAAALRGRGARRAPARSGARRPATTGRWCSCSPSARRWWSATWSTWCCPGRSWRPACRAGCSVWSVSVLAGAAVAFLGRGWAEPPGPAAAAYGAVLGLVAGAGGAGRSYLVVEVTADDAGTGARARRRPRGRWPSCRRPPAGGVRRRWRWPCRPCCERA